MTDVEDQAAPERRTAVRTGVITAILGLAVGVGVGFVAFGDGLGAGGTSDEDLAASHAEYGCDIAERLEQTYTGDDALGPIGSEPLFHEAPAVASLLQAAAILDPAYADLGEVGQQSMVDLSQANFEELITGAAQACAER